MFSLDIFYISCRVTNEVCMAECMTKNAFIDVFMAIYIINQW